MPRPIRSFLTDERGAVSLDWVVLTAVLVGTGLSVLGTVSGGVETAGLATAQQLRGHAVRVSFQGEVCVGGIAALQAREDARIASGGDDGIIVRDWMATYHDGLDDTAILQEYQRLASGRLGTGAWTRDHTILTALECELVLRGLD